MKIGILTFHRAYNNGAYLQACALCNRLNMETVIDAEIIDYLMLKEKQLYDITGYSLPRKIRRILNGTYSFYKKNRNAFERAVTDPVMKKSEHYLCSDSIEEFQQFVMGKYDVIIVGSDEVWKVNNFRGFPSPYWLPGNLKCRKMSYAASARVDFQSVLSQDEFNRLREYVKDFELVSVRDYKTLNQLLSLGAIESSVIKSCDPSFLYDFDISAVHASDKIRMNRRYKPNRKTVLVITANSEAAKKIQHDLGKKYNLVAAVAPHNGYINVSGITPLEWVSLIRDCDFVISSLFHAACFSIIQNTPFISIDDRKTEDSKLSELLDDKRLKNRYISDWKSIVDFDCLIDSMSDCDGFSEYVIDQRHTFQTFLDELYRAVQ